MKNFRSQRGNVLVISLFMLVIMTTLVVSSMQSSTVSTKIVGNVQNQRNAEAAAQAVIDDMMATSSSFVGTSGSILSTATLDGWNVSVQSFYLGCPCGGKPDLDSSEDVRDFAGTGLTMACWDLMASVKDTANTGTQVVLHQGIRRNQKCPT